MKGGGGRTRGSLALVTVGNKYEGDSDGLEGEAQEDGCVVAGRVLQLAVNHR